LSFLPASDHGAKRVRVGWSALRVGPVFRIELQGRSFIASHTSRGLQLWSVCAKPQNKQPEKWRRQNMTRKLLIWLLESPGPKSAWGRSILSFSYRMLKASARRHVRLANEKMDLAALMSHAVISAKTEEKSDADK